VKWADRGSPGLGRVMSETQRRRELAGPGPTRCSKGRLPASGDWAMGSCSRAAHMYRTEAMHVGLPGLVRYQTQWHSRAVRGRKGRVKRTYGGACRDPMMQGTGARMQPRKLITFSAGLGRQTWKPGSCLSVLSFFHSPGSNNTDPRIRHVRNPQAGHANRPLRCTRES
jgi:hypothetical protein